MIGETDTSIDAKKVKRLLACSGKVYYDLVAQRKERGRDDVAIVRVEQVYPFPHKVFGAEVRKYANLNEIVWVQDEPQNQGFWFQVQHNLREHMTDGMKLAMRAVPPRPRLRRATTRNSWPARKSCSRTPLPS